MGGGGLMEMTNLDAHTCVEKHMEFPAYKCFLFHARFANARGICVAPVTDNSELLQEAEPRQMSVYLTPPPSRESSVSMRFIY